MPGKLSSVGIGRRRGGGDADSVGACHQRHRERRHAGAAACKRSPDELPPNMRHRRPVLIWTKSADSVRPEEGLADHYGRDGGRHFAAGGGCQRRYLRSGTAGAAHLQGIDFAGKTMWERPRPSAEQRSAKIANRGKARFKNNGVVRGSESAPESGDCGGVCCGRAEKKGRSPQS